MCVCGGGGGGVNGICESDGECVRKKECQGESVSVRAQGGRGMEGV